jgi:hypothetical protein
MTESILVTAAFASEEHARRAIDFLTAHLDARIVTTTTVTDERAAGGLAVVDVRVERSAESLAVTLLRGVHGIVISQRTHEGSASVAS